MILGPKLVIGTNTFNILAQLQSLATNLVEFLIAWRLMENPGTALTLAGKMSLGAEIEGNWQLEG